jgi:phospholipid-transporting ATPase
MEVVKFQQAQLINSDLDMYYARTDTPAVCRTSSLVEELGQIEYVFSDKTGTLTCNEMEFRCSSIAGVAYSEVVDENKRADGEEGKENGWRTFAEMSTFLDESSNPFVDVASGSNGTPADREREVIREFLTLLAVCHTVIPEVKNGKTTYQASSPDEAALVAGAELLGYQFHVSLQFDLEVKNPLTCDADAQTKVRLRKHSRPIAGIRDSERLRVQFNTQAHVYRRSNTGRKDQALLQRC